MIVGQMTSLCKHYAALTDLLYSEMHASNHDKDSIIHLTNAKELLQTFSTQHELFLNLFYENKSPITLISGTYPLSSSSVLSY